MVILLRTYVERYYIPVVRPKHHSLYVIPASHIGTVVRLALSVRDYRAQSLGLHVNRASILVGTTGTYHVYKIQFAKNPIS